MNLPYRIAIAASNQPTAAQAYEHGGTALTAHLAPASVLADGQEVLLLAQQVDGSGVANGAWEICRATWNDAATDNFGSRTLISSSSGSLIDWSAAGVNATPNLYVLGVPSNEGRRLHSAGTLSGGSLTVGGASNAFRAGYDYVIDLAGVTFDTNNVFVHMRWYEDGVGVDSTGTDHHDSLQGAAGASAINDSNTGDTLHYLHPSNTGLNNAEAVSARVELYDPMAGGVLRAVTQIWLRFSASRAGFRGTLSKAPSAFNAAGVQLFPSSGNFSGGTYRVWEIPR